MSFLKRDKEYHNLFVDRYTYDQSKNKKINDKFFSSRLDLEFRKQNFDLSNVLFYEILECIKIELNFIF